MSFTEFIYPFWQVPVCHLVYLVRKVLGEGMQYIPAPDSSTLRSEGPCTDPGACRQHQDKKSV